MAGALKQSFIEAVRLTPDGIADFLDTPIPQAPTISTPADVDAAIIASGVLSKFLLDFFRPFAGLTPVELLLRIGQHNSVLESAMIAGLEYIEGADPDENAITIIEPEDGITYTPGEMRFTAEVSNGVCTGMTLTLGGDPIKMVDKTGTWTQFVNMDVGDYTATFEASFEGGAAQSEAVSFSIMDYDIENPPVPPPPEPPDPGGGDDLAALGRARATVLLKYRDVIRDARKLTFGLDDIRPFYSAIDTFLSICPDTPTIIFLKDRIDGYKTEINAAIYRIDGNTIITKSSAIINEINAIYTTIAG